MSDVHGQITPASGVIEEAPPERQIHWQGWAPHICQKATAAEARAWLARMVAEAGGDEKADPTAVFVEAITFSLGASLTLVADQWVAVQVQRRIWTCEPQCADWRTCEHRYDLSAFVDGDTFDLALARAYEWFRDKRAVLGVVHTGPVTGEMRADSAEA